MEKISGKDFFYQFTSYLYPISRQLTGVVHSIKLNPE